MCHGIFSFNHLIFMLKKCTLPVDGTKLAEIFWVMQTVDLGGVDATVAKYQG